jgi:glycogen debranching enzyme
MMNSGVRVPHSIEILYGGGLALACNLNGELYQEELHGLFAADTRVLSTYRIGIAGQAWHLLGRSRPDHHRAQWEFQNPLLRGPTGEIAAGSLHLRLARRVDGLLRDDVHVRSFLPHAVRVRLTFLLDADFADIFEVRSGAFPPRLNIARVARGPAIALHYERKGFRRGLQISFQSNSAPPIFTGSLVTFELALSPAAEWTCRIDAVPELGSAMASAVLPPPPDPRTAEPRGVPEAGRLVLVADPLVARPFARGRADLHSLAVLQPAAPPYVVAGVPWFFTLFGRDPLVTALMAGLDGSWLAEGTLAALGPLQATQRDDFRDAEPGKLPHELRRGELAARSAIVQSPCYYGAHDVPALYCLALWQAWRWTGARRLLDTHLGTARAALRWCEELGDRDGDGLLEYATRSPQGYYNQSWKDAGDAILDEDGRIAALPLATVELQGYFFAACLAMAELLDEQGDASEAERLRRVARALRARVEEHFWLKDQGFYAVALDGRKRPVTSVTSNPGHLLWCGLPTRARATAVATRLLQPDLFSGWGLRTLSSRHRAYNPLAYQRGSVWPHDTALAAAGLWRYGLHEPAGILLRSLLEAATAFEAERLPELFCGLDRADGLPVPYEDANSPQAWAAAAPVLAVQLFLGLVPDAPRGRCFLAPRLPEWLPRLELRGIAIGRGRLDVAIARRGPDTVIEQLRCEDLAVIQGTVEAPLWGQPRRDEPQ